MKRLHVHVSVEDLDQSVQFYSTLFATKPAIVKPDYAKWMLDEPRVNFAISTRSGRAGLDHLGIQVESQDELHEVYVSIHEHVESHESVMIPCSAHRVAGALECGRPRTASDMTAASCAIRATWRMTNGPGSSR